MKKLLDADITGENKANNILNEKITSVKAGVTYYIEHGIYFSDTLTVFVNPADSSSRLSLNADYEYAELDSIATAGGCYSYLTDISGIRQPKFAKRQTRRKIIFRLPQTKN